MPEAFPGFPESDPLDQALISYSVGMEIALQRADGKVTRLDGMISAGLGKKSCERDLGGCGHSWPRSLKLNPELLPFHGFCLWRG